jgi:PAS domain S-box-containing protein
LAYWIVTSHDGSIEPAVTANGTTITISLPRKPTVGGYQQLTELSRSRDKYKAAFDEAADAIVIADEDGQFVEINGSASELFGMPESELLGRTIAEFASDGVDVASHHFRDANEEQGTFRLVRPDGSERVVEYAATPDIIPGEHLWVFRDISQRKEQKRELTALKERYETLLEAAPDPVFVADAESGELLETNAAAESMLGKSRADIVGHQQSTLHPSDRVEQYRQLFEEQVHSGGTRRYLPDGSPIYVVTNDGEQIPVEISIGKVSLPDGPVAFGIFRDISERYEREQQTRRLKERLDLAIEAGSIGVWEWEIGSNTIRWDESMERLLGMEPGTFPETWDGFTGLIHPDDLDRVESEIESALAAGNRANYSFRMETAGGEYRWIETRLQVLADANGDPMRVLGVGIDITDRMEQD